MGDGTAFDKQNIVTYTIGFESNQPLLQRTATHGGGEYYTAEAYSELRRRPLRPDSPCPRSSRQNACLCRASRADQSDESRCMRATRSTLDSLSPRTERSLDRKHQTLRSRSGRYSARRARDRGDDNRRPDQGEFPILVDASRQRWSGGGEGWSRRSPE